MATVLQDASKLANRLVLRLCERLGEPDKLSEFIFATTIAFTVLGAGICAMEELEKFSPGRLLVSEINLEMSWPAVEQKHQPELQPPAAATRLHARLRNQVAQNHNAEPAEAPSAKPAASASSDAIASPNAANASPIPEQTAASPLTAGIGAANAATIPTTNNAANTATPDAGGSPSLAKPQADLNAVAGSDFGAQKTLAVAVQTPRMGNISPYRRDLLARLAKSWQPSKKYDRLVLALTINKEGKLINDELVESSGSSKLDKEALDVVESMEYAPLPDWFKGDHITWQLDVSTIVADQ